MHQKRGSKIDTHLWQTWWSVVGPKLPNEEIRIGTNIFISPLSDSEFQTMKNHRAPVPTVTPSGDSFVVGYPPRDEVQSRYRLQIDVQAAGTDEACTLAMQIADRLIVSLSLSISGGRYFAELRKLKRFDQIVEYTAYSQSVRATILENPINIHIDDINKALIILKSIENDSTTQIAYSHLLAAWQLQTTSGSKPLDRPILQSYVLCIEAIVNGFMTKYRSDKKDEIRLSERKFAAGFAETLIKRADKPEAIRQANAELRKISMSNAIPSIEHVAKELEIKNEITEKAKDLYRFRSRNLSHPGRSDGDEMAKWLSSGPKITDICLADQISRLFLTRYCEFKSSKGSINV